jgi:hypothetical protein
MECFLLDYILFGHFISCLIWVNHKNLQCIWEAWQCCIFKHSGEIGTFTRTFHFSWISSKSVLLLFCRHTLLIWFVIWIQVVAVAFIQNNE